MTFLRPTLKDVAKLSGVSEISVSRVMRDAPNISRRLREKVEAAALELNYTPNKIAGALASNTTDLIGVVLPSVKSFEYAQILSGIESALVKSKYRMMLGISDFSETLEATVVRDFLAWNPAGVIILDGGGSTVSSQMIKRPETRLVEILNGDTYPLDVGVGISFQKAILELVSHWQQQGVKNIAYIGSESFFAKNFKGTLRKQLDAVGIGLVHQAVVDKPSSIALRAKMCAEILQQSSECHAIFFEDADLAMGAAFHCSMKSLEKISIASFNNSSQIDIEQAEIDLIKVPFQTLGVNAAKYFLGASNDDSSVQTKTITFPAEFVQRQC